MKKFISSLFLVIFLQAMPGLAANQEILSFDENSYQDIIKQNQKQAFMVVLWSIDCPPCLKELTVLNQYHHKHPQHRIILIATDSIEYFTDVSELIHKYQLQDLQHWIFNGADNRLRYSIDPGWYGELPRSYFFKNNKTPDAHSGQLSYQAIANFFKT